MKSLYQCSSCEKICEDEEVYFISAENENTYYICKTCYKKRKK